MSKNRKKFNRSEKRKLEQMQKKRRNQKMMIGISAIIVILAGFIVVVSMGNNDEEPLPDNTILDPNEISDTQVSISMSEIGAEASFYNYESNGVEIKYFAVDGSDGQPHIAFDACDVCYGNKRGYRQVEGVMKCVNCGNEYPINSLGTENTAGGCWPSYLPMKVDGDNVVIDISDIEDKVWMF